MVEVAVVDREDHQEEVDLNREVLQGVLIIRVQDSPSLHIDTFVHHIRIFLYIMGLMGIICSY